MERRRVTAEDLFNLKIVSDVQVAPDGRTIAFVVTTLDEEKNEYRAAIWTVEANGAGEPRRFTGGAKRDTQPRWSPDGTRLAFVSDRNGKPQVFVMPLAAGEARQLTVQRNGVGEVAWSPDGRQIAFTSRVGPEDEEDERAEAEGKSEEERKKDRANAVVVVESLKYKSDGTPAWLDQRRSHVFTIDVANDTATVKPPEARQVTDGDWDESQIAWSPDGQEIAFVANREENRDTNFRSDLWVVAATGGATRRLTGGDGECATPAWSPDGTTLAYIGHREGDTPGATTRVFTVNRAGGEPTCLTANLDRPLGNYVVGDIGPTSAAPQPPRWLPNGAELLVQVTDGGSTGIHRVARDGGTLRPVATGERVISSFSVSADGACLAFAAADLTHPAELFTLDLTGDVSPRQRTRLNDVWLANVEVSVPERLTWPAAPKKPGKGKKKGRDGTRIEGWLMKPVGFEEGQTYPLVVQIHGGPHGAYGNTFFHEFQLLAAKGYGVLFTNPRGSHGYGDAFVKATHRAWGDKDTRDIMAGLDLAIAQGWVDDARLGVAGGSYGGFMTNWIIGHSDRFAAAVTMRCVSNLQSFSGTSDCGFDLIPQTFGGPWWENRRRYRRYSPISYLDRATTPTLILHSEQDYRCPIEQAEQVFYILKSRGIPTRLVRFPNENHNLSRAGQPKHRLERLGFIVEWFDRFLGTAHLVEDRVDERAAK